MEIIKYPHSILLKKCEKVAVGDEKCARLLDKMLVTLHRVAGAGLAAPQVGIAKRMVVIDLREIDEAQKIYKMINPIFTWKSNVSVESEEGCLSIPFLREIIQRHESVSVEYLDENFQKCTIEKATGFLAYCLQHELDHLDGKLYIDLLSKVKRASALRKYKKLLEEQSKTGENNAPL
ncbi:MAG: peptide deformylase [Holosporaceae bacterium]|jgi:peptide deformylase|nr:peptide deformylase [Holosporaceae bacterium]